MMGTKIRNFTPLPPNVSPAELVSKDHFYRRLETRVNLSFGRELVTPLYAEERQALLDEARQMGCSVPEPFTFLSFITLAGIPEFAVTDKGYVDCQQQAIVEPMVG